MKILYDHQIFEEQRYGGASRYFCEVADHMEEIEVETSTLYSSNYYLLNRSQRLHATEFPIHRNFRGKARIIHFFNKIRSKQYIQRKQFDIFHPTNYDSYFLSYWESNPFVLTVHDMIHEIYAPLRAADPATVANKKLLAEKAAKIIAVSESTKNDLMNILHIHSDKIDVIYHGYSQSIPQVYRTYIPPYDRYILYVGARWGYKNFKTFLRAASILASQDISLNFICSGLPFNETERAMIEELHLKERIIGISVEDWQLDILYRKAQCFVYPSLYEGFGIPVLEAFANECLPVLSRIACFEEVAQDAAVYFDPQNPEELASIILSVISDEALKREIQKRGRLRLMDFSWTKCAQQHRETYLSVL